MSPERLLGAEADLHRARSSELLAELALAAAHARLDLARGHLPALEPTPSTDPVTDPASR